MCYLCYHDVPDIDFESGPLKEKRFFLHGAVFTWKLKP